MRQLSYVGLLVLVLSLSGCFKGFDTIGPDLEGKYIIPFITKDTVLFVESFDGTDLPIFISIPSSEFFNYSAVVVLHGSGGNWKDSDTNDDGIADEVEEWTLSSQNNVWKNTFDDKNVVSAFPGSYYQRGTIENEGEWKNPPLQFQISASFVRNNDAYLTLEVLRNLVWQNGVPIINPDFVGVMGFSHGGTAVQSTIYDQLSTPAGWVWSQSYDGSQYTSEVKEPALIPRSGGFRAAVMYYPGSFHNGYYGNPCNDTSIYGSYIDFLIHLPSEDPLTANSNCMLESIEGKGATATVFTYEGANHGFDGKTSGTDASASTVARERTLAYLGTKLSFE